MILIAAGAALSLLAGAILFVCAAYAGIDIKRYYGQRAAFFNRLYDLVCALYEGIAGSRTPLNRIMRGFALLKNDAMSSFLTELSDSLEKGVRPLPEQAAAMLPGAILKPEEKTAIAALISSLGKGDAASQLRILSEFKQRAEHLRKDADVAVKTKGALYMRLSVLGGLALLIICA